MNKTGLQAPTTPAGPKPGTAARSLWDLGQEERELQRLLIESGGEITDEIKVRLDQLTMDLGDAVDRYGYKVAALEAQAANHLARAKFHELQASGLKSIAEGLRARLLVAMRASGRKTLDGEDFAASIRETKAVEITDLGLLPKEFWRYPPPPDPEPAKTVIRKAIDAGRDVPGAKLVVHEHLKLE